MPLLFVYAQLIVYVPSKAVQTPPPSWSFL
jgi:hypothetical protein